MHKCCVQLHYFPTGVYTCLHPAQHPHNAVFSISLPLYTNPRRQSIHFPRSWPLSYPLSPLNLWLLFELFINRATEHILFCGWFLSVRMSVNSSILLHVAGVCVCVLVPQSCLALWDPLDCSTPGFPVLHHFLGFAQTHVHWDSDTIQPSHLLSPPFSCSQFFQGLFQWVGSSHQVAKVLELQLQHQSFQWIFRTDSFRIDWFDLLAVQGTLKSLQHQSLKASILRRSVFLGEGNGTPLQYSCLENPMGRGAWWAAVHGVTRSPTWLSDLTFTFMHWRRKWQPTPVFLPGESQGRGSLVSCRLWGRTESDTTAAT